MFVSGLLVPLSTSYKERATILIAISRFIDLQRSPKALAYYAGISLNDPSGLGHEGTGSFCEIMLAERFIKLNLLDHYVLDLRNCQTFDQYLLSLNHNHRRLVKRNMRIFSQKSVYIETIDNYLADAHEIYDLYCRTRDNNIAKGGPVFFTDINQEVFSKMGSFIGENIFGAMARSKATGESLGFTINFLDGNYAIAKYIGQNYINSIEAHTYFNLLYWNIKAAIDRHCDYLDFCTFHYAIKRRLGAVPFSAPVYIKVKSNIIKRFLLYLNDHLGEMHLNEQIREE